MKVVIDRIEGSIAVLQDYDNEKISFDLPLSYLPEGARAGDHLSVSFTLDPASRLETEESVGDLLKELTEGNDPSQTKFKL